MMASRTLKQAASWVWRNGGLVLEAVRLTWSVEVELKTLPFTRVLSRLHRRSHRLPAPASPLSAAIVNRAIRLAYRVVPFRRTCLKESLIFCRIFHRRGLPAELRIGVKKDGRHLSAHAWVEDGTGALLTDALDGFEPMSLPARR